MTTKEQKEEDIIREYDIALMYFNFIDDDKVEIMLSGDQGLKDFFSDLPDGILKEYNKGSAAIFDKKEAAEVWDWCRKNCWRPKFVKTDLFKYKGRKKFFHFILPIKGRQ